VSLAILAGSAFLFIKRAQQNVGAPAASEA
jgi:hypothetical protein